MDHLPMWLQYYSKVLFDTINRSGSGEITKGDMQTVICNKARGYFQSYGRMVVMVLVVVKLVHV